MARRRSRPTALPGSRQALDQFKLQVMRDKGIAKGADDPNEVKFEVAKTLGVPLQRGYNGQLSTEDAGKIGGQIGGTMVKEMIRMAQEQLANQHQRR